MRGQQVPLEPVTSRQCRFGERAGLLEQMGRAGYHDQLGDAAQGRSSTTVQFQDVQVGAADEKESGRPHLAEPLAGKVRATTPRHDCSDLIAELGGGVQGGPSTRAGAEVPDPATSRVLPFERPPGRSDEPAGEQRDVEDLFTVCLLYTSPSPRD